MRSFSGIARRCGLILVALALLFSLLGTGNNVAAEGAVETEFLSILNAERAAQGKSPLRANASLWTAAYLHSKDMGDKNYFSHTSQDGRTFVQRIVAAGYTNYTSLGENIAYAWGAPSAAVVYNMWKNSAGHYANMMENFADAGLGVYSVRGYTYYTLDLGRRYTTPTPTPTPTPKPTPTPTPIPTPTPVPGFSVAASPAGLSVTAGSTGNTTITVTPVNGFSDTVSLTATTPAGWGATVSPASVYISTATPQTAKLTLTVPSTTAPGAYSVSVTGRSGTLTRSVIVSVNVQSAPVTPKVPSAPQNLKATPGNSLVALTWTAPTNNGGAAITGYRVYRRTGAAAAIVIATTGNMLSYTDASVANGQTYYYTVTAVNIVGESPRSAEVAATPSAPTAAKALNVAVATSSPSYPRGTYGRVIINVTDSVTGAGVPGATVLVRFYYPSGVSAGSIYRSSDAAGKVDFSFNLGSSAQLGTYRITVNASKFGYATGAGQTTFTIY